MSEPGINDPRPEYIGWRLFVRRIPLFILFNTVLASFIGLFQFENFGKQFTAFQYMAMAQIMVHIGFTGAAAIAFPLGDGLQRKYREISYARLMLIMVPAVVVIGVIAIGMGVGVVELTLGVRPFKDLRTYFYMSFIPTVLVSAVVTLVIGRFEFGKFQGKQSDASSGLSCKVGPNHYFVPFADIVYLSSHGRFTVVHAKDREYKVSRLLKELLERLPNSDFVRIHKSYIVSTRNLSHAQYMMGGTYVVYLKDSEETTLPVGRKFVPELKRIMGMS